MAQLAYQRFTITVPDNMARQIDQVCALEGRNRSELFREAVRLYFAGGALAGASAIGNLGTNDLSKSLAGADSENEIENILSSKIKESEKLLKSKLETHFKNFSINLSTNLNKIIKTNMEEFKKKIDTALADFIA